MSAVLSPPRTASAVAAPATPVGSSTGVAPAEQALDLLARVLEARSLDAAAHALVTALAAQAGLARATLGWHDRGRTRLLASSQLELARTPPDLSQRLLGAMDEALDQARTLAWPQAGDGSAPICLEQRALQQLAGGAVATVPLGRQGEAFAALCVERETALPFTAAELRALEQLMSLAAPALQWMDQGAQPWTRRARRELAQAWQALRQPERKTTRRLAAVGVLALLLLALLPLPREVAGRARVEGAEQRVLVAPADGFVKRTLVRPGDQVLAGQTLVDLLDGDLRLERERWSSQLAQHENAYAAAMAKSDRTAASTSLARISEAQSQLALVDETLVRGTVVAPFDALVIQGDLSQSIGAPVRQGDTLLTLASTGRHRVIVDVDEVDIARVHTGQSGTLSLSSLPWNSEDLVVERITPLARAVDGRNVFEVEARLLAPSPHIRPGLLGRAHITVGRQPPLWAWLGQALQRARVAWWSWLG